jgi:hypothetical protein
MPSSPIPNAATRWNLVISEQTNVAVRSFLARRGFKKGDLSAFVEEAVRWRVFDQMLGQAREGLDGLAAADAENLLDEALSQVREEGLANARYEAFQSATPPLVAMEAAPPYRAGKPKATAKKSATKKPAAKKSV